MAKFLKRMTALALMAMMATAATACSSDKDSSGGVGGGAAGATNVWSTSALNKVLQTQVYESRGAAKVDVSLAQGESESAQIILTPEKDVKAFTVSTADLKNAQGDVLSKDNVLVYQQKYIEVVSKTYNQKNEAYPEGWYPDMLLPMDIAVEYKENTIKAGNNQGITFDISVPVGQAAGTYTGSFTVTIDGKNTEIPVSVKVWDFALEQTYGRTCYAIWSRTMMYGELDNTSEEYKVYYETMLNKYKAPLFIVPNPENTAEDYAENVLGYFDNPYFNSYGIPLFGQGHNLVVGELEEYVYQLAKMSTSEKFLLDKAYIYNYLCDEPHDEAAFAATEKIDGQIKDIKVNVYERLAAEDAFDGDAALGERVKTALEDIPVLITAHDMQYADIIDAYCPQIQNFSTDYQREQYNTHAESRSGVNWMYTCMEPIYPYPSHHIDDALVGARALRWMQYDYDIEGYLFWAISEYYNQGNDVMIGSAYENPIRFAQGDRTFNGDGYWVYPGAKYGSKEFFPSVRLLSIRDSQEDYDMLSVLGELLTEAEEKYGVAAGSFDKEKILASVFDELYSGTIYNESVDEFSAIREYVASLVEMLNGDMQLVVTDSVATANGVDFEVYAESGTTLTLGSNTVSSVATGDGVKFSVHLDTAEIAQGLALTATKGEKSVQIDYLLPNSIVAVSNFKNSMNMSEGAQITADTADSVSLTVKSGGATPDEQIWFEPYFGLTKDVFGGDFSKVDSIYFTLENESAFDMVITLKLYKSAISYEVEKITLKANSTKSVKINNVNGYNITGIADVKQLRLDFANVDDDGQLIADRALTVSNVYYTTRG